MAPTTLARRLPAALLVTLVASAALTFGIGAAYASGEEPLPETFGVQPVREGDRGTYVLSGYTHLEGDWFGEPIDETTELDGNNTRFEWRPLRPMHDDDGSPRIVRPLLWGEDVGEHGSIFAEHLIDAETGRNMALRMGLNSTTPWLGPTDVLPVYVGDRSANATSETIYTWYNRSSIPCGLVHDLQGQTQPTRDGLRVSGTCMQGAAGDADSDEGPFLFLQAHSMERIDGFESVRFDHEDTNGTVSLWLAREISVPLRISIQFDQDLGGLRQRGEVAWSLTSFENGTARGEEVPMLPPPLVKPSLQPVPPMGPDGSILGLAYPLPVAWQDAQWDPDFSAFLQDEPDAFIHSAGSFTLGSGSQQYHGWYFAAQGQDAVVTGIVLRDERMIPLAAAGPIVGLLPDVGRPHVPFVAPLSIFQVTEGGYLPFGPVDELPSVASVADMWMAYDPEADLEGEGLSWGFTRGCLFIFPCSIETPGAVIVGQQPHYESEADLMYQVFGGERVWQDSYSALTIQSDGRLAAFSQGQTKAVENREGLLPTSPAPETEPEPSDEALATTSPFWQWPSTPEAAAGVGFLGVLVGVIYWLWPTLKGGLGVGLFSRLRQDQVLAHPMREGILAAVEAEPGLHQSELQRRLGTSRGTLDHHLKQLLARGLVVRKQQGGYVCFFPGRGVGRDEMEALTWLRGEGARDVLVAVDASPGCNGREVARSTGLDAATVSYHLKRLREGGLVEATREGRALVVRPTALGSRLAAAS